MRDRQPLLPPRRSAAREVRVELFRRAAAARRRSRAIRCASRATMRSSSTRRPAPLLSVFGGKITTYRRLAEDAIDLLVRDARGARRCPGRRAPACPAGTAARQLRRVPARARAALSVVAAGAAACATHTRTARASSGCSAAAGSRRARHAAAAADCTSARWRTCAARSSRAPPRTFCGAVQARTAPARTRTRVRSSAGWPRTTRKSHLRREGRQRRVTSIAIFG